MIPRVDKISILTLDQFRMIGGDLRATGKVSENKPEVVYFCGEYSQWMVMLPPENPNVTMTIKKR